MNYVTNDALYMNDLFANESLLIMESPRKGRNNVVFVRFSY